MKGGIRNVWLRKSLLFVLGPRRLVSLRAFGRGYEKMYEEKGFRHLEVCRRWSHAEKGYRPSLIAPWAGSPIMHASLRPRFETSWASAPHSVPDSPARLDGDQKGLSVDGLGGAWRAPPLLGG